MEEPEYVNLKIDDTAECKINKVKQKDDIWIKDKSTAKVEGKPPFKKKDGIMIKSKSRQNSNNELTFKQQEEDARVTIKSSHDKPMNKNGLVVKVKDGSMLKMKDEEINRTRSFTKPKYDSKFISIDPVDEIADVASIQYESSFEINNESTDRNRENSRMSEEIKLKIDDQPVHANREIAGITDELRINNYIDPCFKEIEISEDPLYRNSLRDNHANKYELRDNLYADDIYEEITSSHVGTLPVEISNRPEIKKPSVIPMMLLVVAIVAVITALAICATYYLIGRRIENSDWMNKLQIKHIADLFEKMEKTIEKLTEEVNESLQEVGKLIIKTQNTLNKIQWKIVNTTGTPE